MAKTTTKRKRSYSGSKKSKAMPYKKKKTNNKKKKTMTYTKRMRIRKAKGAKLINVKEDREGYSRSYAKQKVTKQQQKLINRRFKNGFSPFKKVITNQYQLVDSSKVNKCRWIWRCNNDLLFIDDCFANYPLDTKSPGASGSNTNIYQISQSQAIYFGQFSYKYEILNPTDYDMNLVIYDIVYKENLLKGVGSENDADAYTTSGNDSPIDLILQGLSSVNVTSGYVVADPTAKTISDISLSPTESYPFNINCKVLRKHTFKLQPGASMVHRFIHKPKNLMTRGYYGYKFKNDIGNSRSIKDLTSGCLFKVWGQVTGLGSGNALDTTKVTTFAGKLMFKEYFEAKWYCMDEKYTYTFRTDNDWTPTSAEIAKLEVVNDAQVHVNKTMDVDDQNNNDPVSSITP